MKKKLFLLFLTSATHASVLSCESQQKMKIEKNGNFYSVMLDLDFHSGFKKLISNSQYDLQLDLVKLNPLRGKIRFQLPQDKCAVIATQQPNIIQCSDEDHPISNVVMEFSSDRSSLWEKRTVPMFFYVRRLEIFNSDPMADLKVLDMAIGIFTSLGRYHQSNQSFFIETCK